MQHISANIHTLEFKATLHVWNRETVVSWRIPERLNLYLNVPFLLQFIQMLLRGPAVYTIDLKRLDFVRKRKLQSKQGQNIFPNKNAECAVRPGKTSSACLQAEKHLGWCLTLST